MSNDGHYGSWDYDAFFHRGSDGHEERSQHDSQRGNQRYDNEERFMFDSYDHRGGYDTRSHHDSRGGNSGYNRSSGYDEHSRREGGYGFGSREYEGSRGGYGYDNRGDYERSSTRGYENHGSYRLSGGYDRGQGGYDGAHGYRDERGHDRETHDYRNERGHDDRGDHGYRNERGHDDRGDHGYRDERGYNDRSREYSIDDLIAGYGDSSRGGYSECDRGYGHRREDGGYRRENRHERQTHDRRDDRGEDRGYGRRDNNRGGDHNRAGGRGYGAGRDGGRGGRRGGRGGAPVATGPGSGTITGSGYDNIGNPVTDPQLLNEWTGTDGVHNVNSDDAELQQSVFIDRRPNVGRGGKTIDIQANYFSVSLHSAPVEIFKYHVSVEKEIDGELNDTGQVQRLPRSLVRKVIDAGLRQYKSDFGGTCVVHDGMSAIYVPSRLYWDFKTLSNINPDDPQSMPTHPTSNHRRTFSMTIKLVEAISTRSLVDYYNNPDVNIMPVLQALNVVACHLGAQRLTNVGRSFFSMQNPTPLGGGKELCWGYHQSIRIGDSKLLMNVDQKATVFYTPGELTEIVLPMVDPRSVNDTRGVSDRDKRKLESALKYLEVVPIHRKGWKRAIYGISEQPAYQTMVNIRDEHMSVADYFSKNYNVTLRYPYLPLVNVGRREAGKETWLPIELCKVAPAQRSRNVTEVDTEKILSKTSQPPRARQANTMKQVLQAGFENDPYQAAFGMTVDQNFVKIQARVMDPPEVQFANVSVRPPRGQWDLQRFVDGATLRNWGVVIAANVTERDVSKFVGVLVSIAGKSGLMIDGRPHMIHKDQFRGTQIKELMTMSLKALEERNKGPPQLIMVVMEERSDEEFREINYTSDTVLGILNQCILAENIRDAKPSICRNLSLQINSRLGGKNSILRDPLPLVSTAPTIIIGADVEHPRPGMGSRPSIAAVVASMDCYSAKYIARVAAQTAANDIQHLPHMLRDLLLAFFKNTNRKPEHVIYYRNGVGKGRFHDILEAEIRSLRVAFKMISKNYNPPVTFIVVNKRHHTRAAFLENDSNMAPGTVIDTGIVDSHRFDFFLYGHNGPLGTSVPCHYTVLHDENKMSAEDVQRLTYFLCYTCARCAKSVSCAVPVYYAQVVAERARLYLNESSDTSVARDSFNAGFGFSDLHENLKDSMYFV